MRVIEDIVFSGKDMSLFIKDLTSHFRNLLMVKVTNNPEEVLDMSEENIELVKGQGERLRIEEIMRDIRILQECEESSKVSKQARLYMELAAIKMCKIEYDTSKEVIISRINRIEEAIKSGKIAVRAKTETKEPDMVKESKVAQVTRRPEKKEDASINTSFNEDSKISIDEVKRAWKDILERFKARRAMVVYASLSTGKPVSCNNGLIEIQYEDQYGFNKSRLEKPDTSKLVNEVFSEVLKDGVRVKYSVITEEVRGKTTEEILLDTIGEDALEILDE